MIFNNYNICLINIPLIIQLTVCAKLKSHESAIIYIINLYYLALRIS